ncbi:TonB-dependent siderophore receptor [Fodinicurvata sediminis]|uniref:TonB-dependent siderophore receptor n=1 Tax=Fodinicurvata sediminis TaxID=1121832 RepID=UPI0003B43F28|nr:TonB-dependent siderophore receptor [Fodinicurvata sediminis]
MTDHKIYGRQLIFWSILPLAVMASGSALAQEQDEITLDAIEVEAESDQGLVQDGYVPVSGRLGSKSETPFVEVPQSVSVITESQLDDRNPASLEDALAYTPGVRTGAYGLDPRFDAFFVRGFSATYNGVFQDGLRRFSSPTGLFRSEPYGLEAIEILKGPSSSLYGASTAGGLVNLVTKKPTEHPFREIELQGGSYHRKQANFDLSGPVTEKGTFLYRLTGVVRDSGTEIDGFPDNRVYIAPSFSWKPDEDTTLTVLGEYMDSKVGGTAAYYNDQDGVTDIYSGDPDYNDFTQRQYRVGYELEHSFNKNFTFHSSSRYAGLDNNLEYAYVTDPNSDPVSRAAGRNAEDLSTFVTDNFVQADYETGSLFHTSVAGFNYSWVDYEQEQGFGALPGQGPPPELSFTEKQDQRQFGIYGSHRLEYENFILNLGGRYDWLSAETTTPSGSGRSTVEQEDEEFSWRAALSYRTDLGIVPYISYTTSFTPNIGTLMSGSPAKPTIADQKEVGVKYEIPGYNALITTSLFDIHQKDGVVFDASSGVNQQVQLDLRSRGFEIEGVASLDNGLNLTASYAYTDVEIEKGAQGTEGNTLNGIPKHTFSVYADYTFQEGSLAGLGAGAGLRYSGQSYGNDQNTITNDARFFADASLHYDLGNFDPKLAGARFQVNGYNLLNQEKEVCNAGYCYRDEGRKFIASLRYRF